MDLDGDGIDDVISGSYWPGELYFFKGLGNGRYEKGEVLKDAEGRNLIASKPWASANQPEMDSLASVPFAYDFTGNGAPDLLVGNISGNVVLIPNLGTATEPKFCAEQRIKIQAGGADISVGGGDAGPIMVDFDGDGRDDLIVGAGDGSVWFYRNVSDSGEPRFERGVALITAVNRMAADTESEPTRPMSRVKVHLADYNGNGRLDLLVGDFFSRQMPAPDLSAEQIKIRDELRKEQQEIQQEYQRLYTTIYQELMKDSEDGSINMERLRENEEFMALQQKMMSVMTELQKYEGGWENGGYVWLYPRKAN